MAINQEFLNKYAKAIVKVGINVQKNDNIIINCDLDSLPFVRNIAKICWQAGANDVLIKINDNELQRIAYEDAKLESLQKVEDFKVDYSVALMKNNYHRMSINSEYPGYFSHINEERLRAAQIAKAKASEPLQKYMDQGNIKWVVADTASPYWAKILFPDLDEELAMENLWNLIFQSCHIDANDPIKNWEKHDQYLKLYENWLNKQNFEYLIYEAPNTNLTVHLAENHKWVGGSSTTPNGIKYMANMPTEEILTTPHRNRVDGYVTSTKPLAVMGKIINQFKLIFKDGKVVDFEASENADVLQILLDTDESAMHLGEIALVPHSSPISKTEKLFKATLFDENASCHFALGQSYAETLINGENLSDNQRLKLGANRSLIHVDFMVGSNELNITGVKKDGSKTSILKNGEWAFKL